MSVRPYDPAEPLTEGRTVIEASAGTGKTFTIAAEVTRLVAAEGRDLEEILVVTFTRAATAELRARARRRMLDTLRALRSGDPGNGDEHLAVLLAATPQERTRSVARLDEALTRFDRAQIFTIHGFATRLIAQLGLRARTSTDLDPADIDELLLTHVASDLIVGRFAVDATGRIATGTAVDLARVVVATPDARIVPDADAVTGIARTRVEIAHEMAREVRRRMTLTGAVTWDEALVEVRDALADPEIGQAARTLLQSRYSVALVDEAQDTDPIQWQVIRAVFDPSQLVSIGDPKQSIYSFRGADIESYLTAVDGATTRRSLETNYRSDGPLIEALDTLFTGASFGDDRIGYQPVRAAPGHQQARIQGAGAALTIRRFHQDIPIRRRRDGYFYVNDARQMVAADTAGEIVRLLSSGVTITDNDTTRHLGPGDIAVLCRTRRQVDLVRAELARRRVPSVAARSGGVFASPAAEEWRRFLLAVEHPERTDYVRMAATTLLVGSTLGDVAAFTDDDLLDLQDQMRRWRELLYDRGVPTLVADIHRATNLASRVLTGPDGERTMTDLTHIGDELHTAWRRGRIASLPGWLEAAIDEAQQRAKRNEEEPEARQRRLETDAAAVAVQTIHAAKGLQYPVVLVPYAWDIPRITPDVPVFHDRAPTSGDHPRRRLIDVAGPDGPGFGDHVASAMAEDNAEEGRLLYVALTRAQHHLMVWWIENAAGAADTKLGSLITASGGDPASLPEAGDGTIALSVLADQPSVEEYRAPTGAPARLERARFTRRLDYRWRRASFSSLAPEHPLTGNADTTEHPPRSDETDLDDEAPSPGRGLPMAELPRGARFGTLVHDILEHIRFDDPNLEESLGATVDDALHHEGWDFDPALLISGLLAAIDTPLGPQPDAARLRHLNQDRVLKEMSFELPVRTGDGAVSVGDIGAVMLDHLAPDDPHRPYAAHLTDLSSERFRGYLTGAIDLTTSLPGTSGPRFAVIDFKSHALPATGDTPIHQDYAAEALTGAMGDGNYVLQATLYQVALHRYLQWRLPGYDPATHLGGSIYLFLRGMTGPDTPVIDGERCGVARWTPPAEMIVALSRLFRGDQP